MLCALYGLMGLCPDPHRVSLHIPPPPLTPARACAHRRHAHRQRRAAVRSSGQTRPAPLSPCRSDLPHSSRGSHRVGAQPHSRAAAGSVGHPLRLESAHRRRRAGHASPGDHVGSGTLPAPPSRRARRTMMKGVVEEDPGHVAPQPCVGAARSAPPPSPRRSPDAARRPRRGGTRGGACGRTGQSP